MNNRKVAFFGQISRSDCIFLPNKRQTFSQTNVFLYFCTENFITNLIIN